MEKERAVGAEVPKGRAPTAQHTLPPCLPGSTPEVQRVIARIDPVPGLRKSLWTKPKPGRHTPAPDDSNSVAGRRFKVHRCVQAPAQAPVRQDIRATRAGPPCAARMLGLAHHTERLIEFGELSDCAAAARPLRPTRDASDGTSCCSPPPSRRRFSRASWAAPSGTSATSCASRSGGSSSPLWGALCRSDLDEHDGDPAPLAAPRRAPGQDGPRRTLRSSSW